MITNPNIEILEAAAERLITLNEEMVFVGGCATGLLLTDPAASPVRATIDVDVLVEVATLPNTICFLNSFVSWDSLRIQVKMLPFAVGKPLMPYWMSCPPILRF